MRRIAGLIVVVVLAACTSSTTGAPGSVGGSGSAGPAAGTGSAGPAAGGNGALPADPCAALTLDELKTVTGKTFQPGVKSGTSTTADCEWKQQGGTGVLDLGFKMLDRDGFNLLAKGSANIPVPGVGDQALIIPLISAIDVAKGGVEFTIQPILVAPGDGWKQIATDLAKLVAGRVGG